MGILIGEVLLGLVGRLFLFLKFRNGSKRKLALQSEFDNSYVNAGSIISLKLFAIILGLLILMLLIVVLIKV